MVNYNAQANDRYLDGKIDNLQIWKKVLSQAEIQRVFNCKPLGTEKI